MTWHRERLVQFPQSDVVHIEPGLGEQLRHGKHRPDAHLVGLAARDLKAAKNAERGYALFLGALRVHHDAHRCTVGELTGIARSDHPAGQGGTDLRHPFIGGVRADSLIRRQGDLLGSQSAARLVGDGHGRGEGHDFLLEASRLRCRGGAQLAAHAVLILRLAPDVVALRDGLRRLQHAPVHLRLVLDDPLLLQHAMVRAVLDAGNRFQPAGGVDLAFTRHHPLRRERDRLQPRGAKPVDGQARRADRAAGAQRHLPRDVRAGRAFQERGADDDVFDLIRIDARPLDGMPQHVARIGHGVRHVERAAPGLRKSGAGGRYHYGVGHD